MNEFNCEDNLYVRTIKEAILQSQYRAAKYTNAEMLTLYYSIGGCVSSNPGEGTWGTGASDEIGYRLREELPGLRGFSSGNIKLMRQFFEAWQPYFSAPQDNGSIQKTTASANRLPAAGNFNPGFFMEMYLLSSA